MKDSDQLELINRYLTAYNAFDLDGMLAVLGPSVRFENYSGDQLTVASSGITEFRQLAEHAKALFAEREQRITAIESRDGALIASIAYRGRLPPIFRTARARVPCWTCVARSSFRSTRG